jgi:hypothetical protein
MLLLQYRRAYSTKDKCGLLSPQQPADNVIQRCELGRYCILAGKLQRTQYMSGWCDGVQGGFGFGQQSAPSFALGGQPQAAGIGTIDNKQLTHYTKWEEINQVGQNQLLEME